MKDLDIGIFSLGPILFYPMETKNIKHVTYIKYFCVYTIFSEYCDKLLFSTFHSNQTAVFLGAHIPANQWIIEIKAFIWKALLSMNKRDGNKEENKARKEDSNKRKPCIDWKKPETPDFNERQFTSYDQLYRYFAFETIFDSHLSSVFIKVERERERTTTNNKLYISPFT